MIRFLTRDGVTLEGITPRQVAEQLRASSHNPGHDLSNYMAVTAAAARLQTGSRIRHTTPEEFLTDLEAAGLIERMHDA